MNKIIWKVSSKDVNQASFRYRCLMPLRWMKELDPDTKHIVADNSDILILNNKVKGIIFVKSFSLDDLSLAKKASSAGIPIYIDLCDNFFYRHKIGFHENKREKELLEKAYKNFEAMAKLAKFIVTTGDELANRISAEFPITSEKIKIIPDAVESPEDLEFINKFRQDIKKYKDKDVFGFLARLPRYFFNKDFYRFAYFRIKKKMKLSVSSSTNTDSPHTDPNLKQVISTPLKKVLWFGNAGIPDLYGITDLLTIKDILIDVNDTIPFQLIVCSSKKEIYDEYIQPLQLSSVYINWSLTANNQLLAACDVIIIPNPKNEFTLGKSANRALLALSFRKPVIATYTSALKPLSTLVNFEDWKNNLEGFLCSKDEFEKKWDQNWEKIRSQYCSKNNAIYWIKNVL